MDLFFEFEFNCFLFLDQGVDFYCFIPATGGDLLATRTKWNTCNGSCMRFCTKNNLKVLVINSKPSVFRNWSKILSTRWEVHSIDRIMVMLDHFLDFPILSTPYNNRTGHLVLSLATWGQKSPLVTLGQCWNLMRMPIKFIHLRPKRMFDQIIIMWRNTKINLCFFCILYLLIAFFFGLLLFIVVVGSDFFPLDSLHFGHQTENLGASFSVSLVFQDLTLGFAFYVLFLFFGTWEIEVEICFCERV